ncbi:MAG: WD40 repeat domain-containing protein, partial [Nostoc sp.]
FWSVATGECQKVLQGHSIWVNSVVFSLNGEMIVSADDETTVKLWNVSTGKSVKILQGHTNWVQSVALDRDGEILASGSADTDEIDTAIHEQEQADAIL